MIKLYFKPCPIYFPIIRETRLLVFVANFLLEFRGVQNFDILSFGRFSFNNLDFSCLFQFVTLILACAREFELLSAKK